MTVPALTGEDRLMVLMLTVKILQSDVCVLTPHHTGANHHTDQLQYQKYFIFYFIFCVRLGTSNIFKCYNYQHPTYIYFYQRNPLNF